MTDARALRRQDDAPRLFPAPDVTLITGLSGAGRSEAAKCLEDLGYFVVDNLPPSLIPKMAELVEAAGGPQRLAIVADARGGKFFGDLEEAFRELRKRRIAIRTLFLEAAEDVLVRRFAETRRKHPLAPEDRRVDGIRREREIMEALRGEADLIIDTSELTPQMLRERVRDVFSRTVPEGAMQVAVVSFGYKYGVPRDADLVLDVRFLPNPFWVEELRPLPGTEDTVRKHVMGQPQYIKFMERLLALLDEMLPGYLSEGKSYLTIAVGCTGGHHRSVVVAEELSGYFRDRGLPVSREHRDLQRD
ncbi:MAG: RNase adapter RapZ [Actinomycetota bacterium]